MTHMSETVLHRVADHMMGFAQAALDATALGLVALLVLTALPGQEADQATPGPMARAICIADCIETLPLQPGDLSGS